MGTANVNNLWMGDLEPYMTEEFIHSAFSAMNETIVGVKTIWNTKTGQPAGYCFVEFSDPNAARMAMLRLNSKTVPNSVPPKRFKLNLASFRNEHLLVPEFSLFVGELSEDVDDYTLYSAFSARYKSCYAVKVVLSSDGRSRGFGFIRFTNETDQQRALLEMQNHTGIGQKPIKVSMATPKGRMNRSSTLSQSQNNWSQTYQQQQQQQWWQAYQQPASFYYSQDATANMDAYAAQSVTGMDDYSQGGQVEDEVLEDPNLDVDIDKLNKEFMEQSEELYTALEGSRWHPLDNVMSPISVNTK